MPDLIRRRWGKPSTNSCSCWRGKRRRSSRTWPPHCHTYPRLHKGLLAPALHVCGRLWRALEAGFVPALDKDQAYMFTPSELRLYRHAQDRRLLSRDILGYPILFGNILGLSTGQFLSCRGSRIAPYNRMNVTFLVYADNAVYQICTHTVKSHGPDKGTILVAVVPGSADRFRRHANL